MVGANDVRGKTRLRQGYGFTPAPGEKLPYPQRRTLDQIEWLVVHHTGAGNGRPSLADTIAWQIGPNAQAPFPGLAYSGFIEPDGTIWLAWDIETVTWSQGDNSPTSIGGVGIFNYQGVAFCFSGEDPTPKQIEAYKRILLGLLAVLGRSILVRSHRDVCGTGDTECPGDAAEAAIPAIQRFKAIS